MTMNLIRFTLLATSLAIPQAALAQTANPQGSGPIIAALAWLQGTLMGNVATAIAVMSVLRW